ncbi:DNA polymerase III subunit gamma and tau [Corynebacterium sp. CCM 9203]|uniref:DNA polymerase III subunit gamma and tau n=1 Tax=Corynebacterium sp. CCM 9203 TaxID=3057615 RepID=UPI0035243F1D
MALYRKYRPATFSEVIGQEHVTDPLSVALDSGRINHAYLFSGPRGCGKTSSARIMARSLNCVEGPTSTPCGTCNSCVSLAPGGPGNLDVTELDAASHNGVDDMRELRDRALYAPAESRYRVFIIDEAHMITTAGANALLKIVEEPPAHLVFIFATTEPEKVLGTIRSRTHHYPFRLLTPPAMRSLLERTCRAEGVDVEDAVYPLVIRAGGGSPRDSLSVMDQLLAGAGPHGLTYEMAVPLLGVTDSSLIDAAVNALAQGDRATMFRTVADVIEAGHDPRRFTSDLLDRLRDLMILQAVPGAIEMGLVDVPAAQVAGITEQASAFGGSALARLAALANDGLDEMRGATAPRLLLEILCARMLLPAGTDSVAGVSQRLDLIEQGLSQLPDAPPPARAAALAASNQEQSQQQSEASTSADSGVTQPSPGSPRESVRRARETAERIARRGSSRTRKPTETPAPTPTPEPGHPPAENTDSAARGVDKREEVPAAEDPAALVRRNWEQLRRTIGANNKVAEIMLTEATVLGVRGTTLVIGHNTGALAARLNAPTNNGAIVAALKNELQLDFDVVCEVGTSPFDFAPPAPPEVPAQSAPKPESEPQPEPAPDREMTPHQEIAPKPSPETENMKQARQGPATETSVDEPPVDGWAAPAPLGGPASETPADTGSTGDGGERPERLTSPGERSWKGTITRVTKQREQYPTPREEGASEDTHSFTGGVPLPPEPFDDDAPMPDDPYGYSDDEGVPRVGEAPMPRQAISSSEVSHPDVGRERTDDQPQQPGPADPDPVHGIDEEEEDMLREAESGPGTLDRRTSRDIAMELLSAELGARQL